MLVAGYQPGIDRKMLQQALAMARILGSDQVDRLQRFQRTGADITEVANRCRNEE